MDMFEVSSSGMMMDRKDLFSEEPLWTVYQLIVFLQERKRRRRKNVYVDTNQL
jgi:hypothetical protein